MVSLATTPLCSFVFSQFYAIEIVHLGTAAPVNQKSNDGTGSGTHLKRIDAVYKGYKINGT